MRRAKQHKAEEHFSTASLLYVNHNKNFSKMLIKFQNFTFLSILIKTQNSKKIMFKLFLNFLKHLSTLLLFEFCGYVDSAEY